MGERWLTFRVWLGHIGMGRSGWQYYLGKVREAKALGTIPMNWPSYDTRTNALEEEE